MSTESSVSWTSGPPPPRIVENVGKDNSSATKGSSVARVAGKNRAPAKPCASAPVAAPVAIAPANKAARVIVQDMICSNVEGCAAARAWTRGQLEAWDQMIVTGGALVT